MTLSEALYLKRLQWSCSVATTSRVPMCEGWCELVNCWKRANMLTTLKKVKRKMFKDIYETFKIVTKPVHLTKS